MMHIAERFLIHFACSAFLVLAIYYAIRFWSARNHKVDPWVSTIPQHLLVTSALIVAALLPLREPYDIWAGNNTILKSCFDQASWFIGAAVSAWGIFRFLKVAK
jgi:putative effector of murein hydrolase